MEFYLWMENAYSERKTLTGMSRTHFFCSYFQKSFSGELYTFWAVIPGLQPHSVFIMCFTLYDVFVQGEFNFLGITHEYEYL